MLISFGNQCKASRRMPANKAGDFAIRASPGDYRALQAVSPRLLDEFLVH